MVSTTINFERSVANIFNSAIAAAAVGAAWEVGLLDAVRYQKSVNVRDFATQNDLDSDSVQGLVSALAVVNIIERDQDTAMAGFLLEEAYRTKSLFHWLTLGSGGLFSRMQYALRNKNRTGAYYHRDPTAISYACSEANRQFFDPVFWPAIDKLKFNKVIDLGSGSGSRLMDILDRYPGTSGVGVDIAGAAVEAASAEASKRGYGDRLSFIEGNVCKLEYSKEFAQVDLLTCFLMGHDFWPRENCIAILQRLRQTFPRASRFFLGDTTRILLNTEGSKYAVTEDDVPIFTLGFEFGHALMGVYLPTMDEWESVFKEGGWRCVKTHFIQPPSLSVIFELEHA
uniref:Methyltransferase n=1 Tax=Discosia rubi TaxID=2502037 RepID=A0A6M6I714_9PEZI|nr:methyltransferase [Discosia rubi]